MAEITQVKMQIVDLLIKIMNFFHLLFRPRKFSNFRWANIVRDALNFVGELVPKGQFTMVYSRITSKYNYHPLQRHKNAIRQFDVLSTLRDAMTEYGNISFYTAVCGAVHLNPQRRWDVDLTAISDLSTVASAGDYIYREVYQRKLKRFSRESQDGQDPDQKAQEAAKVARTNYMRGFTRPINVFDYDDWERLRNEIRRRKHEGSNIEDHTESGISLIALSYKGKAVNITRRMRLVEEDGTPDEDSGVVAQTTVEMTSDFLDDFRWSQLVRSCMEIARMEKTTVVRVWIDRLIMMEYEKEEIARRYDMVDWEEFGLFAYAVCPVVRLYGQEEKYFGSDFWRKLETVLGVAGRGIVVEDYMLRKYDETIFYGREMYKRYDNGLSRIGGDGYYVRGTTLALATAILTDGVTTTAANEDGRTKSAVGEWKAWALRTIAEGAYSKEHFSMLAKEDPFTVGFEQFRIIAFWESFVSRSIYLTGKSYLDMSYQRSMTWMTSASWDGVLEWIGRIENSCILQDREKILSFITRNVDMELWTTTTGHVASWITLRSEDRRDAGLVHKRNLVINLSRFSTAKHGHVTGIAEATGLWNGKVLPPYLIHVPNPDEDQCAEVTDDKVVYTYKPMKVEYVFATYLILLLVGGGIVGFLAFLGTSGFLGVVGFLVVCLLVLIIVVVIRSLNWPWVDQTDVGEALFDNLVLHSLYESGIKTQYRKLEVTRYDEMARNWN